MSRKWFFLLCCLVLFVLALVGCRPAADGGETDNAQQPPATPAAGAYDCSPVSEIPAAECQALTAFYAATKGSAWSGEGGPWEEGDTAWLVGDTPCNWVGVTCDGGHVTMLTLFFNEIQGQLPAELAALPALRVLDLHNNRIGGEIPAALGDLANLESLDLSANELRGSIPSALGNLAQLQGLWLPHNELSGAIPGELGNLAALHTLDLAYNRLESEIPAALAELDGLQTLRLNDNQLEGAIPAGLGELPALGEVNLAFNRLSGPVPATLAPAIGRTLWGNRLDGTIEAAAGETVQAYGVQFAGDPALATTVWPEELPAVAPAPDDPWWILMPAHARLTLVGAAGASNHAPMGISVPGEAQIHVYPVAAFDASWQEQVGALEQLLAEMPADLPGQLPLLPPTNAGQLFHAQVAALDFQNGRGLRYLTQQAQGLVPVTNDQIFYTFQGLTDDGAVYVAAFFPVTAPMLPANGMEAMTLPGMEAILMGPGTGYLSETTAALNAQRTDSFTPELDRIDALISSLSVMTPADTAPVAALAGRWPDAGEPVDGEPVLQWAAFPGATQYELVVVDDDAYPPFVAFAETGSATEVAVTPALQPGSYSWTVRAQDADGAVLAELNSDFAVYAELALVQPADMAETAASPTLQWEPFADAANYEVTVVTGYPPEAIFTTTTEEARVTVTPPLTSQDVHYWTVWAKDDQGRVVAALTSSFIVAP